MAEFENNPPWHYIDEIRRQKYLRRLMCDQLVQAVKDKESDRIQALQSDIATCQCVIMALSDISGLRSESIASVEQERG